VNVKQQLEEENLRIHVSLFYTNLFLDVHGVTCYKVPFSPFHLLLLLQR